VFRDVRAPEILERFRLSEIDYLLPGPCRRRRWRCGPTATPLPCKKASPRPSAQWTRRLPLAQPRTMDQMMDEHLAGDRFSAGPLHQFRRCGPLLLAAVGIYGVMGVRGGAANHEIGLRIGLARVADEFSDSSSRRHGPWPRPDSPWDWRCMVRGPGYEKACFYGTGVIDSASLAVVAGRPAGFGAAGLLVPGRRATAVDPMTPYASSKPERRLRSFGANALCCIRRSRPTWSAMCERYVAISLASLYGTYRAQALRCAYNGKARAFCPLRVTAHHNASQCRCDRRHNRLMKLLMFLSHLPPLRWRSRRFKVKVTGHGRPSS